MGLGPHHIPPHTNGVDLCEEANVRDLLGGGPTPVIINALLESGEADAFKGDQSNKVLHYKKGDFFGELALLNDQPRAASIMASTEVKVATLGKNAFQRLLGPVEGILRRTRYEGVATGVEEMDPLHRD
jgi:cAMP-dependent protein kinase regulator